MAQLRHPEQPIVLGHLDDVGSCRCRPPVLDQPITVRCGDEEEIPVSGGRRRFARVGAQPCRCVRRSLVALANRRRTAVWLIGGEVALHTDVPRHRGIVISLREWPVLVGSVIDRSRRRAHCIECAPVDGEHQRPVLGRDARHGRAGQQTPAPEKDGVVPDRNFLARCAREFDECSNSSSRVIEHRVSMRRFQEVEDVTSVVARGAHPGNMPHEARSRQTKVGLTERSSCAWLRGGS
jgi:hypothetical protein